VQGSDNPSRSFPQGVTVIPPGLLAFVLATAVLEVSRDGFRSFAFTVQGSLTVLHRSLKLPSNCIDRIRWVHIGRLRDLLRQELMTEEAKHPADTPWRQAPPLLANSEVEICARSLMRVVPHDDGAMQEVAQSDKGFDDRPGDLRKWTVDLDIGDENWVGPEAFRPFAAWTDLEARRQLVEERKGCSFGGIPRASAVDRQERRRNPREDTEGAKLPPLQRRRSKPRSRPRSGLRSRPRSRGRSRRRSVRASRRIADPGRRDDRREVRRDDRRDERRDERREDRRDERRDERQDDRRDERKDERRDSDISRLLEASGSNSSGKRPPLRNPRDLLLVPREGRRRSRSRSRRDSDRIDSRRKRRGR